MTRSENEFVIVLKIYQFMCYDPEIFQKQGMKSNFSGKSTYKT